MNEWLNANGSFQFLTTSLLKQNRVRVNLKSKYISELQFSGLPIAILSTEYVGPINFTKDEGYSKVHI